MRFTVVHSNTKNAESSNGYSQVYSEGQQSKVHFYLSCIIREDYSDLSSLLQT